VSADEYPQQQGAGPQTRPNETTLDREADEDTATHSLILGVAGGRI